MKEQNEYKVEVIKMINEVIARDGIISDVKIVIDGQDEFMTTIDEPIDVNDEKIVRIQINSEHASKEEKAIIEMIMVRASNEYGNEYEQAIANGVETAISIMEDMYEISEWDITQKYHDVSMY